jgi:hypothetical protein
MEVDQMLHHGILNTGSWIVIVKGNTRGTAPAGVSALPLITICCGWNGALPQGG